MNTTSTFGGNPAVAPCSDVEMEKARATVGVTVPEVMTMNFTS
jgi:hypothetical protein